jgi:hypothetical protein
MPALREDGVHFLAARGKPRYDGTDSILKTLPRATFPLKV